MLVVSTLHPLLLLPLASLSVSAFLVFYYAQVSKKRKAEATIVPGVPLVPDPHWFFGHMVKLSGNGDFRRGQRAVYEEPADENGMVTYWFLSSPAVSVLLGKDVRAVLMASSFRSPIRILQRHSDRFLGRRALVQLMGKEWKYYRSAVHRAFTPTALQNSQRAIERVCDKLVRSLRDAVERSADGSTFKAEILPIMKMGTIDIFGETSFGVDLRCCTELHLTPVARAFDFLTEEYTRRLRGLFNPASQLYWLPTPTNIRHARERRLIRSFLDDVVSCRRKEIGDGSVNGKDDLLTYLIGAIDDQTSGSNKNLSDDGNSSTETLTDVLMVLLFGGYDTTSITLSYALYLLSTHSEVEATCLEEIRSVMDVREKSGESSRHGINRTVLDIEKLQYTRAVVLETLRLYPPAPITTRNLERSLVMNGVTIPAGTHVCIPIWSVQRCERNYPRAVEFLPERWVSKSDDEVGKWSERTNADDNDKMGDGVAGSVPAADRDAFCAFSGGGRSCPGRKLAVQEAVTILAYLLHSFRFEAVEDYDLIPVQSSFIQKPSENMPMRVRRR